MSDSVLPSNTAEASDVTQAPSEASLPEVLRTPTQPKSLGWRLLLSAGHLVVFMALIPTFQILVPNQLAALDAAHKTTLLSIVVLAGAIPAFLGNLLGGALSDRTTSRFGRRRPWILSASLLTALALVVLALAPSFAVIVIGAILIEFALNVAQATLTALVPDQVPVNQRAFVGAFAGFALPLGAVLGVAVIAQIFHGKPTTYYALAAILVIVSVLFVILMPDPALPKGSAPAFRPGEFLASFVQPLKGADFTLVLLGRVFVMFGYYVISVFLIYYLQDAVGIKDATVATSRVGIFQLLMTLFVIISTLVTGALSDRLGRRKPFVIGSGVIIALSLVILAVLPKLPLVFVAGAVLGLGFGTFLANDLALQTLVLPSRRDNGKDLGILSLGSLLPQILVPIIIGGLLAALNQNYLVTFLVGAVLTVVGSLLIFPVRSVR
jgi:MFS family permease